MSTIGRGIEDTERAPTKQWGEVLRLRTESASGWRSLVHCPGHWPGRPLFPTWTHLKWAAGSILPQRAQFSRLPSCFLPSFLFVEVQGTTRLLRFWTAGAFLGSKTPLETQNMPVRLPPVSSTCPLSAWRCSQICVFTFSFSLPFPLNSEMASWRPRGSSGKASLVMDSLSSESASSYRF